MAVYRANFSAIVSLQALITTPTDFDKTKESLPMVVCLHGAGERGEDLERVKIHGIAKYFDADPDYRGLRVITLSPQCPADFVWPNLAVPLMELISSVIRAYHVDPDRVSITGLSMGGFGTWEMLNAFPNFFSAAAPICGGGMSWRIPEHMKTPVRAFHGYDDPVVPYSLSVDMVEGVNRRGGNATLTTYHGCGHNSWDPAYETTDVIEWLATSVRKK